MNRNHSTLTLLGPAAAIFALYSLLINLGHQAEANRTVAKLEKAQKSAVTPVELSARQTRLQSLQQTVRELTEQQTRLRSAMVDCETDRSSDHLQTIERLTRILHDHQLKLVQQSIQAKIGEKTLPGSLSAAIDLLATNKIKRERRIWSVQCEGPYLSMMQVLNAIASAECGAIPLGVEMEQADLKSATRTWKLQVLI